MSTDATPPRTLTAIATLIVLETPERSSYAQQSYVRRELIAELEASLRLRGVDIDALRKRMKAIMAARKLAGKVTP